MIKLESWHCVTVTGGKGQGKTFLEKYGLLPNYKNLFCFDPNGEFLEYPSYQPETDSPKELEKIAKIIWNRWNCMLLVSEAELYLPVNKPLTPNVFKIISRGRHRNVGMIADTRRIAELNKTVFGLSEHVFLFRVWSPTDHQYLAKFIPQDVKPLAKLPLHHFWHYTGGEVTECLPLKVPNAKPIPKNKRKDLEQENLQFDKETEESVATS
ncbi:MAG: hypothetical protein ABIH76_01550 [Candidatus Bathyarchaeota archaeon]